MDRSNSRRWTMHSLVIALCFVLIIGTSIMTSGSVSGVNAHRFFAPGTPYASPEARPSGDARVEIEQFLFKPASIEIASGTSVTWINRDGGAHTVTDSDGNFDSGRLTNGASFSVTFNTPGTYSYVCFYHANMTGTVSVTP